ncbi:alanine racemase [Parvularcula maris]|uniref:alanine racemase n=1 Tax=Parvularcula maris TaxID=2965077 RepID=A0A9X2L8A5_9PROT|nr:alanine racemase [Parvularcula maris]MCQ8184954.1 alanine racemase [Parvularcula maris]
MRTRSATLPGTDPRPRLTVDLGAVRRNMAALRALRPSVPVMPVVKANCYGLGSARIVPVLAEAGASGFFISYKEEAERIAEYADGLPFYVLNTLPGADGYTDQIRPVHHSVEELLAFKGPCGMQVEGGMNRIGAQLDDVSRLPPQTQVDLVILHMSHAGEPAAEANDDQRTAFSDAKVALREVFPNAAFGHSATGGALQGGHPEEDFIRPGIGLYGAKAGQLGPMDCAATLEAAVLSVFEVKPGEKVGYSHRFTAQRPTRLATLGIGYADGPPRSLLHRGKALLNGVRCPYAGAVSMDLLTVDVTDAGEIARGDWAEIFGPNLPVDELAEMAGTIGYELLTAVRGRTQRVYVDEG